MSTIQDIRALEQRITDIVEDYINELYNEDDILEISVNREQIKLTVGAKKKIKTNDDLPLRSLVRYDEGNLESDIDKISFIANQWLFFT